MRRALVVGIDNYSSATLNGCVNDAMRIANLLARNDDGSANFDCKRLLSPPGSLTKSILKSEIEQLFKKDAQIALFYFSGHGYNVDPLGGHLVTTDAQKSDLGVSMQDILAFANSSPVKEIFIILDCCDSGAFGQIPSINNNISFLRHGISILTASGPSESALESNGRGIFTQLVCDALEGGASDVRGEINAASIYSYCDQILGAWDQRPSFMTNVSELVELRLCTPQVPNEILRKLIEYFPNQDHVYPLYPTYEPDKEKLVDKTINLNHEIIFGHLQKYRAAHLLVPVDAEHLYYAAANSKSCKLTPLGKLYWKVVKKGKL